MRAFLTIGLIFALSLLFGAQINNPTQVAKNVVVSGCPVQSVLFTTSTSLLGCNSTFTENDAGTAVIVPNGSFGNPGLKFVNGQGFFANGTASFQYYPNGGASPVNAWSNNSTGDFDMVSTGCIYWSPTSNAANVPDLGLCRNAAGVVEIDSGSTPGTFSEEKLRSIIYGGAVPTVGGSCGSFGTPVGGNTNGTISSTAICGAASTITLTFAFTAPTGWNCAIDDRTSATAALRQTGTTQTVATFTVTGATGANDILQYGPCGAY